MKSFKSNLWVVATVCSAISLVGCQTDYSFSPMPIPNSSGLVSGANPLPSASPQPSQSPTASPTMSASPSPSPSSCTETCTVPNGVGVQACGAPASTCSVTQCNPGYVIDNGMCVPVTSVNNFSCSSYEELVLNAATNQLTISTGGPIPAQNASGAGVCYYYPLVLETAPLTGSSYLTGTDAAHHDQGVAARDHDVDPGNPSDVWHPYTMANVEVNITFAGPRTLHLTGGAVKGTMFTVDDVQIDNFFLVGVFPQDTNLTPANLKSYYSAWGTADSTINATVDTAPVTGIAFNPAGINLATNSSYMYPDKTSTPYSSDGLVTASDYAMIPLNVEATGGTASVPEVSLSNLIMPAVSTTVDFRGLDCGSARYLDSVYLLIQ